MVNTHTVIMSHNSDHAVVVVYSEGRFLVVKEIQVGMKYLTYIRVKGKTIKIKVLIINILKFRCVSNRHHKVNCKLNVNDDPHSGTK